MSSIGPFFNFDNVRRAELFDNETLRSLNTYRNWGPFVAPIQKIFDTTTQTEKPLSNVNVKSLFNPVYSVGYNQFLQVRQNSPILDNPEIRQEMRRGKDCSIKALVEASQKNMLGREVFSYADFMYCKHLGKISNNYLITLRRFPFPAADHINYIDPFDDNENGTKGNMQHNPDCGRLVTWLGTPGNDMSNILKWTVKMPYDEMKGQEQNGGSGGGDSGGLLGTFLNAATNKQYQSQMVKGYAGSSTYSYMNNMKGPTSWAMKGLEFLGDPSQAPYQGQSFIDSNKIFGPVNVINRTNIRQVGLNFDQNIDLTFDYELRSYDGINPRMAFLDLLGNILAVTFDNGAFWGGAYRGSGPSQSNIFANLPIYKLNGSESFSDVVGTFVESGQQVYKSIGGGSGNFLTDLKNIAQTLAKGVFSALLGASLNALGRPQKQGVNSLLSPAPVGFWHLTIGNPWHPIMSIGNLILEDATIEQYGPLGLDDFPTGIKVNCKLKHGKDRDSTMIEHMFMQGEDRVYTPVDTEVMEMYKAADPIVCEKIFKKKQEAYEKKQRMEKRINKIVTGDPWVLRNFAQEVNAAVELKKNPPEEPSISEEDIVAEKDSQLAAEKELLTRHFYQWFGTKDEEVITTIAREAAYGSKQSGKDRTGQTK